MITLSYGTLYLAISASASFGLIIGGLLGANKLGRGS